MCYRRKKDGSHFLRLDLQFFNSGDITTYCDDLCPPIDHLGLNLNILFGVFRLEYTVHIDVSYFYYRSVNQVIPQAMLIKVLLIINKLFFFTISRGRNKFIFIFISYQCQFLMVLGIFLIDFQTRSTLLNVIFEEVVRHQVFHFGVFKVMIWRGANQSHHFTISECNLLRGNVDNEDTVRKQTESIFEGCIHLKDH